MIGQQAQLKARVATCSPDASLAYENQLVKAALLYADEVVLRSPSALLALRFDELRDTMRIGDLIKDLPDGYLPKLDWDTAELKEAFRLMRKRIRVGTPTEKVRCRHALIHSEKKLRQAVVSANLVDEQCAAELRLLQREGLLTVESHEDWTLGSCFAAASGLSVPSDDWMTYFLDGIVRGISDPGVLPLFDERSADVVSAMVREGLMRVSELERSESRESAMANYLVRNLPAFPELTAEQMLETRAQLAGALVGFRGAVVRYGDQVRASGWEVGEFEGEAQRVFRREVAPAVESLEKEIAGNSIVKRWGLNLVGKESTVSAAAAGVATSSGVLESSLSIANTMPNMLSILAAGGVAALAKSLREWSALRNECRQNELYYYVRLRRL